MTTIKELDERIKEVEKGIDNMENLKEIGSSIYKHSLAQRTEWERIIELKLLKEWRDDLIANKKDELKSLWNIYNNKNYLGNTDDQSLSYGVFGTQYCLTLKDIKKRIDELNIELFGEGVQDK